MADISTEMPIKVVAGDTWQWRVEDLTDYPASEGWSLKYTFLNSSGKVSIDASADGDNFLVSEAAAGTANHSAGIYSWEASVSKGGDRFRVGTGTIEVLPNFTAQTSLDTRSHARKVLESIEAVLEKRATKDQEEYSIEGRSLKRTPLTELIKLRDKYRREVSNEEAAENLKKGLGSGRMILTRF